MTDNPVAYPYRRIGDFTEGWECSTPFVITAEDVDAFVAVSGDDHPLHSDVEFARSRGYAGVVVHGALVVARCSAFIAREFVGSHGLLLSIGADFRRPIQCGQALVWVGKADRVNAHSATVEVAWQVRGEDGTVLHRGKAAAWVPAS